MPGWPYTSTEWSLNAWANDPGFGTVVLTDNYSNRQGACVSNLELEVDGLEVQVTLEAAATGADGFGIGLVPTADYFGSLGDSCGLRSPTKLGLGLLLQTYGNTLVYWNNSDDSDSSDNHDTGIDFRTLSDYRVTFTKPTGTTLSAHFEKLTGTTVDVTYTFPGAVSFSTAHLAITAGTGGGSAVHYLHDVVVTEPPPPTVLRPHMNVRLNQKMAGFRSRW